MDRYILFMAPLMVSAFGYFCPKSDRMPAFGMGSTILYKSTEPQISLTWPKKYPIFQTACLRSLPYVNRLLGPFCALVAKN